MSQVFRVLIEESLETMEGGRFQDFCLEFLPLYDSRFEGLSRVGHTAGGKTRPGTPDLLKTDASGQTGVQCGTGEDYWPPVDAVEGSKPYEDGRKCIGVLERPIEVVLVSNRETPARTPNIKLAIMKALQVSTGVQITLLGREDLSQFLITRLEEQPVRRLMAKFCPEMASALEDHEDADGLRVLRAVAETRSIDLRAVLPIVVEAMTSAPSIQAATGYVLERLDELNQCRLPALPTFAGVVRSSVAGLPLATPYGKVWVLTGVPKVGKTNVVVQLARAWGDSAVQWFECPLSDTEECAEEIAAELVRLVLPQEAATPLLRSPTKLDAALAGAKPSNPPTVIVVDNADRLPATGLHRLGEVLKLLRRHGLLADLACVFIAARRLGPLRSAVDETITAPAWSPEELGLLLDHLGLPRDREHPERYLDVLTARSGGHPLLALALARRHVDLPQLLLSVLDGVPALADEDLSREAKQLLYDELLTDADMQNFVQRLSVLLERTPTDVLETLRREVAPPISTSTGVLLDQLSPLVIEGSAETGFQVAFVFREVAKRMISPAEVQAVYRAAADRLLSPQGRNLVALRTCAGILYAVFGGDIGRGIFWTTMLLRSALNQKIPDSMVAGLLTRMAVMSALHPPEDFPGRVSHALMLLMFAQAYGRIGQYEKAADVLSGVNVEDDAEDSPRKLRDELPQLRLFVALSRVINLLLARRDGARSAVESLGPAEFGALPPRQRSIALETLAEIVHREGLSERTPRTLRAAIEQIDGGDRRGRTGALHVAVAVGFAASRPEAGIPVFEECFPENVLGRVLGHVARGVFSIERGDGHEGRQSLEAAVAVARAQGWIRGAFWSDMQGHLGDAARLAGDDTAAVAAYTESRAAGNASSFRWAWSSWRLGLLRDDVGALADAARGFGALGLTAMWARAVGARGALLLKSGQELSGLQCFADVLEAHYGRRDMSTGPAATVALAHLARHYAQREGRPIADETSEFPTLRSAPYDLVLAAASPRAGAVAAFFVLGESFKGAGSEPEARRFLKRAADVAPENETDRILQPLALSTLIGVLGCSEVDRAEIRQRFQQFLTMPRAADRDALFAQCMFAEDGGHSWPADGGQRLDALVTGLEQGLADARISSAFWEAEILCGRARLGHGRSEERGQIVQLWDQAMGKAIASQNWRVMLKAGLALGFEFAEHIRSFRQLARCQFECLRGAELGGISVEFLGNNLFRQWSHLDYRVLSERDLETKRMLMDTAHEMVRAGTPESNAGPAMVLLLARLHQHEGPSTEWARRQLSGDYSRIPEDVRRRLEGVSDA